MQTDKVKDSHQEIDRPRALLDKAERNTGRRNNKKRSEIRHDDRKKKRHRFIKKSFCFSFLRFQSFQLRDFLIYGLEF